MNLQPINPPTAAPLLCTHCRQWTATMADLDGEPFKAYYCPQCAAALRARLLMLAAEMRHQLTQDHRK